MASELKKKYGLLTAICMVVGIVVGSGVFFKAEAILNHTGGDLKLGILAWVIGGIVMIVSAYAFSILATKYEKVNGVVDYAEAAVGEKYGYLVGWFLTTIYYPTLTMALAWLSARFTLVAIYGDKADITGGLCFCLTCVYLIGSFALNTLSPIISGKFQVSTTLVKLVPLLLMAVVGTVYGLTKGYTIENFTTVVNEIPVSQALFKAVCATVFAYEGWIIATSINAELKDAKKNLPKALVLGSFITVAIYVLYYIGLAGAVPNAEMMASGQAAAKRAFASVFGNFAGTGIFVFVIISCLGTLNGLMLGCSRGLYSLSSRGRGPSPKVFSNIDKNTNMPANSSVFALLLCAVWLLFFYASQMSDFSDKLGMFAFDPTELPIVTIYPFYIPIFVKMIASKELKDLGIFKRIIAPILAIACCIFITVAAIIAHAPKIPGYLILFAVSMLIGVAYMKKKKI